MKKKYMWNHHLAGRFFRAGENSHVNRVYFLGDRGVEENPIPPSPRASNFKALECFVKLIWLVVEPTHLKNMIVKLEIFPKDSGS